MSEIHEAIEKAQEGEHAEGFNKRVALVIAILALFLSFSETAGKGAQTEAISKNVESSDLWAFFQAKNIRITQVTTAAEEMAVTAAGAVLGYRGTATHTTAEVEAVARRRLLAEPDSLTGRRARVRLRDAAEGHQSLTGELVGASERDVTIASPGGVVTIPFEQIARSNLVPGE